MTLHINVNFVVFAICLAVVSCVSIVAACRKQKQPDDYFLARSNRRGG